MSPQQTKELLRVLTRTVERYEKLNEPIPTPPQNLLKESD